jgi:hypothetical protein
MAEKKSILEEALLDIKRIQNAINANTKEILRSAAREEIDGVVKESLMDEVYEEEELDTDDLGGETELGSTGPDMGADAGPMGGDELGGELGDDSLEGGLGDMEGPVAEPGLGDDLGGDELGMGADALGGDDMDMTAASDDEVIAIYKKLSGEDEIEIVGDEIHLNVSEPGEYVVKMAKGGAPAMGGAELGGGLGDEELGGELGGEDLGDELGGEESDDDVDYEIELDDEEPEGDTGVEGGHEEGDEEEEESDEEEEVEPLEEKIQVGKGRIVPNTLTDIKGAGGKANKVEAPNVTAPNRMNESVNKAKKLVLETTRKYNSLLTEASKLQAENVEYKKALKVFRNKLVESVIFNENLANATNLFLSYSTTKTEKDSILKRFDDVKSIKESKRLFSVIGNELKSRTTITESVNNKIIKEATTSTSKHLNESTAYVDPSTKRILDLIQRVERK